MFPSRVLLRRIVDVSQGNALFALELGRSVRRGGVPAGNPDMILPASVEDALGARAVALIPGVRPVRRSGRAQPRLRPGSSSPSACTSWRRQSVCRIWPPGYRGGMAETQREPVPRVDSGELDTALAFLSFARHCVLKKAGGLSDEQLRRVLVDSGTSVLGLVQHLAEAERCWFGYHLVGTAWDAGREYGMAVSANRAAADVLRDYRAAIEDSDRAIRVVGDPEARFVVPVDGNRAHAPVGHGPHDERDRPARRTRGHPPGAARRHYWSLNPASAAGRQPLDQGRHRPSGNSSAPHAAAAPSRYRPTPASSPLPTPLPDDLRDALDPIHRLPGRTNLSQVGASDGHHHAPGQCPGGHGSVLRYQHSA